jgi:hypothetical protein
MSKFRGNAEVVCSQQAFRIVTQSGLLRGFSVERRRVLNYDTLWPIAPRWGKAMQKHTFAATVFGAAFLLGLGSSEMIHAQMAGYTTKQVFKTDLGNLPGQEAIIYASEWPPGFSDTVYLGRGISSVILSQNVYRGQIDNTSVIQVGGMGGMGPCTRITPVGVGCFCNGGVILRKELAPKTWILARGSLYIRPNWHLTDHKGMHGGGMVCTKDFDANPEQKRQWMRGGA